MAVKNKRARKGPPKRRAERGQTSLEYLMLLAVAFIAAYLMVTKPVADFTKGLLTDIRNGMVNLVRNAELGRESPEVGSPIHPSNPERLRPVHL